MFVIENVTDFGTRYVQTDAKGNYLCLGEVPTVFKTKLAANEVINQYRILSKNSGKAPSKLVLKTIMIA